MIDLAQYRRFFAEEIGAVARLNERLGKAMMHGPGQWTAVKRLRRDAHDASPSCWFHTDSCCLSL